MDIESQLASIRRVNMLAPPGSSGRNGKKPMYTVTKRKLLVNTGGFVNYDGYIQRKGYAPQDIGTPRIRIEIKEEGSGNNKRYYKDLHASM